jgi:hypothetical protein
MANFLEDRTLDDTDVTKAELKAWVENMDPTADLINPDSALAGLKVSSNKIGINGVIGGWYKYQVTYSDFATAATTSADHTVVSLGAGAVVHYVKLITTTAFTGGGAASVTMDVGTTSGTPTEYLATDSVFTASTTAASGTYTGPSFETENGATAVLARIIADVNCDTLTAGAADIWIYASFADSGL